MLVGHQKQWQYLKKSAQSGRFSHAFLFSGPEKIGKKTLAFQWASSFLGQGLQRMKNHPDFIFIEAKPPGLTDSSAAKPDLVKSLSGREEIQISQIRDLIQRLSLSPSSSLLKIAIIDDAHLMNQEAQTCLLKTLEEPRGRTLLILISDKKEYLFPTILSRVQIIKFNLVNKEEIKKYLLSKKVSEKEAEKISQFSLGRPGIALDLIDDKEKLEKFSQKVEELDKVSDSPFYFRFEYAKKLSEDREEIKETLDIWVSRLRAVLLSRFLAGQSQDQSGQEVSKGGTLSFLLSDQSSFIGYEAKKLKNIIDQIQTIKFLLSSTNVNSRLALETLMMVI